MAKQKSKKKNRPEKISDSILMENIKIAVVEGNYRKMPHAQDRGIERKILKTEFEHVLKTGRRAKKHDQFKEIYKQWNYAIEGRTLDDRSIRVAVSFDEDGLLIITLIDLDLQEEDLYEKEERN